jgi:chromosome segregation ATPase
MTHSFVSSPSHDPEEKQKAVIETLEKEKKLEVTELKKQVQIQADEIKEFKQKAEAVQARNRILEKTNAESKTKLTRVLEKTENDNKLIEALKAELEKAKKQSRIGGTQKGSKQPEIQSTKPSPDLLKRIDDLSRDVQQKDDMIKLLRAELQNTSKKALETMQSSMQYALGDQSKSGDTIREGFELKATIANIEIDKLKELRALQAQKLAELERKLIEQSMSLSTTNLSRQGAASRTTEECRTRTKGSSTCNHQHSQA